MEFGFCTHNAMHFPFFVFKVFAVRFARGVHTCAIFTKIMVEQLLKVTSEYEELLRRCQYVPRFSLGRRMLRDDGAPSGFFSCTCSVKNQTRFISLRPRTIRIILRLGLLVLFHLITYHLYSNSGSSWPVIG